MSWFEWFDNAANESQALRSRAESIEQGAEEIYNLLWGAMVKEVPQSRLTLMTGKGTTFDRTLVHQALPSLGPHTAQQTLRTLHLKLSEDKTRITAKAPKVGNYGNSSVEFQFKPDNNGVLQLMHEDEPIEIRLAAIMVLRNFIFPELPLKDSLS
jgi:hypothetical protein